jgi:hypothetical protein
VAFDASNGFLRCSAGGVFTGGPSTTIAVFHLTHFHSVKDKRRTCIVFDAAPPGISLGANNRAGVKNGHTITFGPLGVSSSGQLHGKFVIATALCNAGASLLDVNGLRTPGAMENVKSENNFVLGLPAGVPQGFGGYPTQIAELMVYDRALMDVECRQLGQYLAIVHYFAAPRLTRGRRHNNLISPVLGQREFLLAPGPVSILRRIRAP